MAVRTAERTAAFMPAAGAPTFRMAREKPVFGEGDRDRHVNAGLRGCSDRQPPGPARLPGVPTPQDATRSRHRAGGLRRRRGLATGIHGTWSLWAQHPRGAAGQVQASVHGCPETSQSPRTSRPAASGQRPRALGEAQTQRGRPAVKAPGVPSEQAAGDTSRANSAWHGRDTAPLPASVCGASPLSSEPGRPSAAGHCGLGRHRQPGSGCSPGPCPEAGAPRRSREGTCRPLGLRRAARASLAPGVKAGWGEGP